jgi:hypothetical protein
MIPFIYCDCNGNCYPSNPGNNNNCKCKPAKEVFYSGTPLLCSGINPKDTIDVALQKIDSKLCGVALVNNVFTAILSNPTLYQEFVDLVNGAIECQTIIDCLPTTTTTTTCFNPDVVDNGFFTDNLDYWNQTTGGSWVWSADHGGSAQYIGTDELSTIYQNVLIPGNTYDISFNLWMNDPGCIDPSLFWIKVYAGDNFYGPFSITGAETINITLECINTQMLGILAYDTCVVNDTIFINNVKASISCPTTTTTTSTTARPVICRNYGLNASTVDTGSWIALDCLGVSVGGDVPSDGGTYYTGCIDSDTIELTAVTVKETINC